MHIRLSNLTHHLFKNKDRVCLPAAAGGAEASHQGQRCCAEAANRHQDLCAEERAVVACDLLLLLMDGTSLSMHYEQTMNLVIDSGWSCVKVAWSFVARIRFHTLIAKLASYTVALHWIADEPSAGTPLIQSAGTGPSP